MSLEERIENLYKQFGPGKIMDNHSSNTRIPQYFLHRNFLGEQDLLIIFNTKRCAYQCSFCSLPLGSSLTWIPSEDILAQFEYVVNEARNSLGVLDRVTISNNGSVLDTRTFAKDALIAIARCTRKLKNVRRLILETRLEFIDLDNLREIKDSNPIAKINILTGFETVDPYIREVILYKRESLKEFLIGLDKVAECDAELTAYILFKPSYTITDEEAIVEAEASIDYVADECSKRDIKFSLRIGPMYAPERSRWARKALSCPAYQPPRLTDVIGLVKKKAKEGIKIYIGLSSEDLAESRNSFIGREDYSKNLIKEAIAINYGKLVYD